MAYQDDVNSEFELQRKRAQQAEQGNLQKNQDAISRRLAQQGGGPSGVGLKLEEQAQNDSANRLQTANEGIDTAQRAENRRIGEVKEGRDYQTSERMGSQGFQAGQADLQRRFATGERLGSQEYQHGERLGSQDFTAGQGDLQRKFLTSERLGTQGFQSGEADKQRAFQDNERLGSEWNQNMMLGRQLDAQGAQFEWQKQVDNWNHDLALQIAGQKDILERLLGPGIDLFGGGDSGGGRKSSGLFGNLTM